MINVLASVWIREGRREDFLKIFSTVIPEVLAEKGCREYQPTVDVDSGIPVQEMDHQVVTIIEKWESLEDLHAHLKSPHMEAYRERVKDIVERVVLKVLRDV